MSVLTLKTAQQNNPQAVLMEFVSAAALKILDLIFAFLLNSEADCSSLKDFKQVINQFQETSYMENTF